MNFWKKDHNWDEVLINSNNIIMTRRQIRDYYYQKIDKIFPYVENKKIMVVIGNGYDSETKEMQFIYKRKNKGKFIRITKKHGIDDDHSLEYYINRKTIEFHTTIGKTTDFIWLDIDIHLENKNKDKLENRKDYLHKVLKENLQDINKYNKQIIKHLNRIVLKSEIYNTGNGYHLTYYLNNRINTDTIRETLKDMYKQKYKDNKDFSVKRDTNKIIFDISTLKNMGNLKVPYSLSKNGFVKDVFTS